MRDPLYGSGIYCAHLKYPQGVILRAVYAMRGTAWAM